MKKGKGNAIQETDRKEKQSNYMSEGMCFGMLAGSVGMSILSMFGLVAWGGVSISVGLLLGMVIGSCIPNNK